jgi:hypothetical protein
LLVWDSLCFVFCLAWLMLSYKKSSWLSH